MMEMKKKALFLIFIVFFYSLPFAFAPTDEGYGEDETSLGQFVDSFENSNNVSVAVDVIQNSTLDVMELNYTGVYTSIYNLTSLREHDRYGAAQTVIVTFSIANNDELRMVDAGLGRAYIFLVVDSGWLDDKYVRFRYYPYSSVVNPIYQTQRFEVHDGTYDRSNNTDFPAGSLPPTKGNGKLYDYVNADGLNNWYTKDFQINTSGGSETNVTVWWVNADAWGGTAIGLYLDWIEINDSAGGSDNLVTINFNNSSPITMEQVGTEGDYGFALSPELPFEAGGYSSEGYFTTDDYMNSTDCNGTSLVLMVNTSIPTDTDIQVQFSNDNVIWRDNEGTALDSNILNDGFESIDLRELNYTDIYFRFNLTTDDFTETPRVYQARLISTIGNSTGGGAAPGPSGSGAIGFIMLTLICSPIIALIVWRKKR